MKSWNLLLKLPHYQRARFWMTFSEEYLTHLRVIQNIGIVGIEPSTTWAWTSSPSISQSGTAQSRRLGRKLYRMTSIGCRIKGIKDGKSRTYYIWNNCSHEAAYKETGTQGVKLYHRRSGNDRRYDVLKGEWNKSEYPM